MQDIISGSTYEAKAVTFKDNQAESEVPLMMTAFDGHHHEVLQQAGFGRRGIIFSMIDGGVGKSFEDPYQVDHWALGPQITEFMLEVKRGWQTYGRAGISWEDVPDEGIVEAGDLEIKEP